MNIKLKEYENKEYKNTDKNISGVYPLLDDKDFNIKIANKKEFNSHKYDGKISKNIEQEADLLCNSEFELSPHQLFVKNFLSNHTPYNSLLLYHGLGTGKTCSAIGICEDMREYMNQLGINKKIIIVASPAVQKNFELQLFDERKLKKVNRLWTLEGCTKNSFLKEVNPSNIVDIDKKTIIQQIKKIIDKQYMFIGYSKFANFISKKLTIPEKAELSTSEQHKYFKKKLCGYFDNTLIVIDEVHNIRINDENREKKISENLLKLVKYVNNVKLLLLSATPMYNSYKEIVWLVNMMNKNDKRSQIKISDIFEKSGEFKKGGKQLLLQKTIGYVSFVKGNNPYIFPYRIYPIQFDKSNSSINVYKQTSYPTTDIFGNKISEHIKYVDLFLNRISGYQYDAYKHICDQITISEKDVKKNGYTTTLQYIYALNIVYPIQDLRSSNYQHLIGREGLERITSHEKTLVNSVEIKYNYSYVPEIEKQFGELFSEKEIGKYSQKISQVCKHIKKGEGITLIYSQYIDGGLIPMALALESMGYSRYGTKYNLLKSNKENDKTKKYAMITGDNRYSLNNELYLKTLTDDDNKDGEKIKVVLISKTGAEGLDFKFIRQVHILEPWFNMNRIEQIIGRAVRTCSHKLLPLEKRNVAIFMHGSYFDKEQSMEPVDMYIYRMAEKKSIEIGRVTRVLKEGSVDCNLNIAQQNFTAERFNHSISQTLFDHTKIKINIGDKSYTEACDYMETCLYKCTPSVSSNVEKIDTFNLSHIKLKRDLLKEKIKLIFKEHFVLHINDITKLINIKRIYDKTQIHSALYYLVNNREELISDKYNRHGNLINVGDYFIFQPKNILNKSLDIQSKISLPDYKKKKINIQLNAPEEIIDTEIEDILDKLITDYNEVLTFKSIKSDKSWYKIVGSIIHTLVDEKYDIDILLRGVIHHQIEHLEFNDKKTLLNYLYNSGGELSEYEHIMLDYFKHNIIKTSSNEFLFLMNKDNSFLIKKDTHWDIASPIQLIEVYEAFKRTINELNKHLASYIGYCSAKDDNITFKLLDRKNMKNKGARCDQLSKTQLIDFLNIFTKPNTFTKENTKKIISNRLAIYLELLIRYKEFTKVDKQLRYLLTPEEAMSINFKN